MCRFLPDDVRIIGYARSQLTDASLRERLQEYLKGDVVMIHEFLDTCTYVQGQVL